MRACVVIPTYKPVPNQWEVISFDRCLEVLRNHPICLVIPEDMDATFYTDKMSGKRVSFFIERFNPDYFKSITGYNFLLLSKEFYNRFAAYGYILIYQLDCFVFEDKLLYWAEKGFDYIGSPLFSHYMDYAPDRPFWYNGNGGLSLRRVKAYLKVLNWRLPLRKKGEMNQYLSELGIPRWQKAVRLYLSYFGFRNTISSFLKSQNYDPNTLHTAVSDNIKRSNEDVLWSNMLRYSHVRIKTPNFEEGLGFSFERSPRYLYEQNGNKLPFGCHAWLKHDLEFWKPHIEKYGYKINP